jgi:hypothetical protein
MIEGSVVSAHGERPFIRLHWPLVQKRRGFWRKESAR